MEIKYKDNNLIIDNINNLDIKKTFECGQCFRWEGVSESEYIGVIQNKVVRAKKEGQTLVFYGIGKEEEGLFREYFNIKEEYEEIIKVISSDDHIIKAIEYGKGIRLLKQDLFETIISFIISANNNIPRIKKIINEFCMLYGDKITYEGKDYFAFPRVENLINITKEDLAPLKVGYRDMYILDAIEKIALGEVDLEKIKDMETNKAKENLMKIKGVGSKVADCILLFSLNRYEVCPIDVWMKKVLASRYNLENVKEKDTIIEINKKWGNYAGIAQQYLFYFEREAGEQA